MATIFEVTAALSGLALFCLLFLGFRSVRADLRSLERSVREGMGVLAVSVSESTATQRRELASAARALPAEPAPAPSPPPSPLARPEVRRLAHRLAEGQDAARARLKLPVLAPSPSSSTPEITITGEDGEDDAEERTKVMEAPKVSALPPVRKEPPPVLKNTGYRYVGRPPAPDVPAVDVLAAPGRAVEEQQPVAPAPTGGVRIGDDEKTPPSGTLVHMGRVPQGDELKARRAGAFPLTRPDADYPAIEVPAPHRSAGFGKS